MWMISVVRAKDGDVVRLDVVFPVEVGPLQVPVPDLAGALVCLLTPEEADSSGSSTHTPLAVIMGPWVDLAADMSVMVDNVQIGDYDTQRIGLLAPSPSTY